MDVELACNIAWHNGYAQGRVELGEEIIKWISDVIGDEETVQKILNKIDELINLR